MRTPVSIAGPAVAFNTPGSMAGASNAGDASTGAAPNQSSVAYGNPGALPYQTQLLSNLATIEHGTGPEIANHYNVQPVFDVYANIDRRDLGGVASQVEKIIARHQDSQDHADFSARPGRHHAELVLSPGPGRASPRSFWYTC